MGTRAPRGPGPRFVVLHGSTSRTVVLFIGCIPEVMVLSIDPQLGNPTSRSTWAAACFAFSH
jgi:hypothetical protein